MNNLKRADHTYPTKVRPGDPVHVSRWAWLLFAALVLSALALDLGLLRRSRGERRELSLRAGAGRSIAWIALSLGFGVVVSLCTPAGDARLSNCVPAREDAIDRQRLCLRLIFSELRIPPAQQRSVLLWEFWVRW